MAGVMGHYAYPSDDGTSYKVRLDASNAVVGGFVATAGTEPALPTGYEMRFAWAQHLTSRRKVWVADVGLPLWTDPGQTVTLDVVGAVPQLYEVRGRIGERRRDV